MKRDGRGFSLPIATNAASDCLGAGIRPSGCLGANDRRLLSHIGYRTLTAERRLYGRRRISSAARNRICAIRFASAPVGSQSRMALRI